MNITDEKETEFIDFDILLTFFLDEYKNVRKNNLKKIKQEFISLQTVTEGQITLN